MKCEVCLNEFPDCAMERHHKDGNGANNSSKNVAILCRKCHDVIHKFSKPKTRIPKDSIMIKKQTILQLLQEVDAALETVKQMREK